MTDGRWPMGDHPITRLPSRFAAAALAAPAAAETAAAAVDAAAVATPAAVTAATEAARPLRSRPRLVHREITAAEVGVVQLVDRLLRVLVGRHLDEREAARPPRGHVAHHLDGIDGARSRE